MDTSSNHVLKFHVTAIAPLFTDKVGSFNQVCQIELNMNLRLKLTNNISFRQSPESNRLANCSILSQEFPSSIQKVIDNISDIEKVLSGMDFQRNN